MTKEQLQNKVEELEEEVDSLRDELDFAYCDLKESEENVQDLELQLKEYESHGVEWIKDLDNFVYRLKMDNLYTEEFENFIQSYMQFYNEGR